MARLIQKCSYIRSGSAGGYMKYIATREGVEMLQGRGPVTAAQEKLIGNLLHDFPESRELFEYTDYTAHPNLETASAFISMALDANAEQLHAENGYMKYIATRPRVQKRGSHGLFGAETNVDLNTAISEMESRQGNVWTVIYSLRREDAARLGYDHADKWRQLLLAHQDEMAAAMGIPIKDFRWYVAFHDEGAHPHIHMMFWSNGPKQGYLTREGVLSMRSQLTNDIFRDELQNLYVRKDLSYRDLTDTARKAMGEWISQMECQTCDSPALESKMAQLARQLETITGKKQYGYLKKPLKKLVDEIVDELARKPAVAQCYEVWNALRDELQLYYKSQQRERLPLSQQKEFRAIKNMIIREAERLRLGEMTFEDEWSRAEYPGSKEYQTGKCMLRQIELTAQRQKAVSLLTDAAEQGNPHAQYALGKLYLQGEQDIEIAQYWLEQSADQGNPYARQLLEHQDQPERASVLLSVTRLLHHMSKVFRGNAMPPGNQINVRMDSKRRKQLMRKRLAMGHKADDHEEQVPAQTIM